MGQNREKTVLFADIAGSTRIYEERGDAQAQVPAHGKTSFKQEPFRRPGGLTLRPMALRPGLAAGLPLSRNLSGPQVRDLRSRTVELGVHRGR